MELWKRPEGFTEGAAPPLSLYLSYFQLLKTAAPLPTPCSPNDVSHGYVPIKVSEHSLGQLSPLRQVT